MPKSKLIIIICSFVFIASVIFLSLYFGVFNRNDKCTLVLKDETKLFDVSIYDTKKFKEFVYQFIMCTENGFVILADYDDLKQDDIIAVLAYATRLSRVKRLQPVLT